MAAPLEGEYEMSGKALFAAAALATAVTAAPAQAQLVRAQDPQSLVRALQNGGYSAELDIDGVNDPKITSSSSGTTFQIFNNNNTNHKKNTTKQNQTNKQHKQTPTLD